jgi:hypothetical protein
VISVTGRAAASKRQQMFGQIILALIAKLVTDPRISLQRKNRLRPILAGMEDAL